MENIGIDPSPINENSENGNNANDSFVSNIERSTNGTWIFCNQEEELKGQQLIKVGNSFLQTKVFFSNSWSYFIINRILLLHF